MPAGERGKRRQDAAAGLQPERRRARLARQLQHRVQVAAQHVPARVGAGRVAQHERPVVDALAQQFQRETGAAFALNAMIEADRVELLAGEPELVLTPSESGKGQKIWRCPRCRIAVWSNYPGAGDAVSRSKSSYVNAKNSRSFRIGPLTEIP